MIISCRICGTLTTSTRTCHSIGHLMWTTSRLHGCLLLVPAQIIMTYLGQIEIFPKLQQYYDYLWYVFLTQGPHANHRISATLGWLDSICAGRTTVWENCTLPDPNISCEPCCGLAFFSFDNTTMFERFSKLLIQSMGTLLTIIDPHSPEENGLFGFRIERADAHCVWIEFLGLLTRPHRSAEVHEYRLAPNGCSSNLWLWIYQPTNQLLY